MTFEVDLKKVERFAAQGMTNEQIAAALGIHRSTYFKKKKNDKDFKDAIKAGQAKGIATITNSLFNGAKQGNVASQIFYLKNRAGWRDKPDEDADDGDAVKSYSVTVTHKVADGTDSPSK